MTAVIVSLVAVVLLVLVVVALGMRSMNKRESSLPPERLKQMAEKEEMTHARSTDEFAAHEPRMNNFSPEFSSMDEVKTPKPVRTGQRGRRGVDEWGNPSSDDEDEDFWANIRSEAEEGGFGAGGTVAARKGASRPVDRERERERAADRPRERRPVTVDPQATTVQAPLPQRPPPPPARPAPAPAPAAASAGLADLVEPVQRPATSASDLADQRTMTFSAPTPDVMSILGAGAQEVPPPPRRDPLSSSGSFPAVNGHSNSGSFPTTNGHPNGRTNGHNGHSNGHSNSGSFPATPSTPIHGAPTSDPFPAAYQNAADPLSTTWTGSGSWPATPAAPAHDILDDAGSGAAGPSGSWPAFEPVQPQSRSSYEVRPGWAVPDDSDPLTGPSPATGTPTTPSRAVSAYDDVLSAPPLTSTPPQQPSAAYETGDYAAPAAWPEPPAGNGSWPSYGEMYGTPTEASPAHQGSNRGGHRRAPEQQDYPDYYR